MAIRSPAAVRMNAETQVTLAPTTRSRQGSWTVELSRTHNIQASISNSCRMPGTCSSFSATIGSPIDMDSSATDLAKRSNYTARPDGGPRQAVEPIRVGGGMPALAVVICFGFYLLGYRVYSKYLATRVFALRVGAITPAHSRRDGIDYVPTNRYVLFGHHFASITGLSPMLGPAIAVIWGWLPAMLWVVLGALLVGCVHDFGALVVSVRARGMSIGVVAEGLIGRRAKSLLHAIIFFGISLAMGVFVFVIARLFSGNYPQAVMPSASILAMALVIGWLVQPARSSTWARSPPRVSS